MKVTLKSCYYHIKAVVMDFHPDIIAAYTASVAWFIMLSFLPFMIVLLSLVRFLPFLQGENVTLNFTFIPDAIRELLQSFVTEIMDNTSSVVLPIGALTGIVSASTGFASLVRGLNIVYKRQESRPLWLVRVMCIVYTIAFLCILVAVLILIVFGKPLYHMLLQSLSQLPLGISRMIDLRSWAVVILLTLFFTLLYKTVPDRKTRWFGEIPGAFVAACVWMAFSHLYSLYISNFGRFSMIYGSLTLIILLMIWLYACIFIVFIGAYINVLLQKTLFSKWLVKKRG